MTIITVVYYVETDLCLPLPSVCLPFINMHKGRVHEVTHCYKLEKKCVSPYKLSAFLRIQLSGKLFLFIWKNIIGTTGLLRLAPGCFNPDWLL